MPSVCIVFFPFFASMFVTGLFFQRHVVRCPVLCLSPLSPCRPVSVSPSLPLLLCMLDMCSVWVRCVSLFVVVCVVVCGCGVWLCVVCGVCVGEEEGRGRHFP